MYPDESQHGRPLGHNRRLLHKGPIVKRRSLLTPIQGRKLRTVTSSKSACPLALSMVRAKEPSQPTPIVLIGCTLYSEGRLNIDVIELVFT